MMYQLILVKDVLLDIIWMMVIVVKMEQYMINIVIVVFINQKIVKHFLKIKIYVKNVLMEII